MAEPILIIQMQRMGDLILSFPLFLWLQRLYPGRRIQVLARRPFFEGLLPFSPAVDYIDPDCWAGWKQRKYTLSINLSFGQVAAKIQAKVRADEKIGPVIEDGALRIYGNWQLYRASLVHNNTHNLMHWADMNALDLVPFSLLRQTCWPQPCLKGKSRRRIGLFIGASQPEKRPDAQFWGGLAEELLRRNFFPVFLGGQAELQLASEIAACTHVNVPSYCGKFSLSQLADFARRLDLLITPDTGPMHLAAWMSVKVLNLSLGPVNPWETGPFQPGHFVLSADISCRGCWQCHQKEIFCRKFFVPSRVATLVQEIVKKDSPQLEKLRPPGLELFISSRFESGLYRLRSAQSVSSDEEMACSLFWQAFFCQILSGTDAALTRQAGATLKTEHLDLFQNMEKGLAELVRLLAACRQNPKFLLDHSAWLKCPSEISPLPGYLQLFIQNQGGTDAAYLRALEFVELALAALEGKD